MGTFSHFTSDGDVHMVNVGAKTSTDRRARASAKIQMQATTLEAIVGHLDAILAHLGLSTPRLRTS